MATLLDDNAVVVFQGDSITDCGRSRTDDTQLGNGYAGMVAAWFAARYPGKRVRFLNRGISGHRVPDLVARWQEDCLALRPTWVSIMIGINDVWRRYDQQDPTSTAAYEDGYHELVRQVVETVAARVMILEPFVLPVPADRLAWREDLDPKIQAARRVARAFQALYIPLDGLFAAASAQREPEFWAGDGVHPSAAGHALIAQAWLQTVQAG